MLRSVTSDFRTCSSSTVTVQWRQSWKGLSRVFFIAAFVIGDPGAVSGGKGKSKQREKHGQRKVGELFAFSPTSSSVSGGKGKSKQRENIGKEKLDGSFPSLQLFLCRCFASCFDFPSPPLTAPGFPSMSCPPWWLHYTQNSSSSFSILFILVIIRLPERLYFFTSKILLFFCGTPCIQEG